MAPHETGRIDVELIVPSPLLPSVRDEGAVEGNLESIAPDPHSPTSHCGLAIEYWVAFSVDGSHAPPLDKVATFLHVFLFSQGGHVNVPLAMVHRPFDGRPVEPEPPSAAPLTFLTVDSPEFVRYPGSIHRSLHSSGNAAPSLLRLVVLRHVNETKLNMLLLDMRPYFDRQRGQFLPTSKEAPPPPSSSIEQKETRGGGQM